MRSRFVSAVVLAFACLRVATGSERVPLTAGWAFHRGEIPGAEQPGFADAAWQTVDVPHDWTIEGARAPEAPSAGGGGFFPTGVGWYRLIFDAPARWQGQRVAVEFEGVYRNAEVWLNGTRLGTHASGYTPSSFDLTPHVRVGGDNVLAVRVDNSAQPNSRYYSGSGIFRPVWLRVTDPVHVVPDSVFIATADLFPALATLDVQAAVQNASPVAVTARVDLAIIDPAGLPVATAETTFPLAAGAEAPVPRKIAVPHPQPWAPRTPTLYRAVTRVFVDGRLADRSETTFGIRTVRFSAERGFELNGEPLELFGGNVHHDTGPLGAAAWPRAEQRKVALLQAAGFNAVRTAHNPPSTAFLDACDRAGLLVIAEAFDGWARAKLPNDYSKDFAANWAADLAAMVRRDRNHPSIVLWSIGNEMYERGNAEGLRLTREMAALVRGLDATRGVTAGLNGLGATGDWTKLDPLFAALDVAGYNYELGRHAADHLRVPGRVIVAAESYQNEAYANWAIAQEHAHVIGDFVWSALDYLGEAGIGRVFPPGEKAAPHWEGSHFPWHGAACGDIDLTGWRKPVSHYRQIVWDRGAKLYAAVREPAPNGGDWNLTAWSMPPARPDWTWPGHEDRELVVDVYSRHESVRLYLNDQLIGEQPTTRAQEFRAGFRVPYAPGVLRAVGVNDGEEGESFVLQTAGAATRLALRPDSRELRADGQDLAFVVVEMVDEAARRCFGADQAVTFTLTGPGSIAGIASGDLATEESYQANPRRLFQGRALVVVRTSTDAGEIKLRVEAEGVHHGIVTLHSR